jgi:hypothetical protein
MRKVKELSLETSKIYLRTNLEFELLSFPLYNSHHDSYAPIKVGMVCRKERALYSKFGSNFTWFKSMWIVRGAETSQNFPTTYSLLTPSTVITKSKLYPFHCTAPVCWSKCEKTRRGKNIQKCFKAIVYKWNLLQGFSKKLSVLE